MFTKIPTESGAVNQSLMVLASKLLRDSVIVSVQRAGGVTIPPGDTVLQAGDLVSDFLCQSNEEGLRSCLLGRGSEEAKGVFGSFILFDCIPLERLRTGGSQAALNPSPFLFIAGPVTSEIQPRTNSNHKPNLIRLLSDVNLLFTLLGNGYGMG